MIQFDQTMLLILLGTNILAISTGIVGSFIVLQEKSLFGDTIAHATLPGIAAIFLFTGLKASWVLMFGGTISALAGAVAIQYISSNSSLKNDTALGIILATSFGVATVLLSHLQNIPNANQAGIAKYMLGNASTIIKSDLWAIICITGLIIICTIAVWKEFKIFLFDCNYAKTLNIDTRKISILMTTLTVLAIVVGLQTVGVILISSLLVAPAVAARQWTNKLHIMLPLSSALAMCSTTAGILLSGSISHLPTGPTIVICATLITFICILFSPSGIISEWLAKNKKIKLINNLHMLSHFMLFNESTTDPDHAHDLMALQALGKKSRPKTLVHLQQEGLIEETEKNFWRLTKKGYALAIQLQVKKQ